MIIAPVEHAMVTSNGVLKNPRSISALCIDKPIEFDRGVLYQELDQAYSQVEWFVALSHFNT